MSKLKMETNPASQTRHPWVRWCTMVILLCGMLGSALASPPIEVLALFKDKAVIKLHGEQALLKVGETSSFGVALVSADPKRAKVRYRDRLYELVLSAKVSASFATPSVHTVRLQRQAGGQYRSPGEINGHGVGFLIDTGASAVAISGRQADKMGIEYKHGQRIEVTTAQGLAWAYVISLDTVKIGAIMMRDVEAMILPGAFPTDVLLGMSFLNRVKMENEAGLLLLTSRE